MTWWGVCVFPSCCFGIGSYFYPGYSNSCGSVFGVSACANWYCDGFRHWKAAPPCTGYRQLDGNYGSYAVCFRRNWTWSQLHSFHADFEFYADWDGLFLCQTGISSMLQQEVDHGHIIPKNRDFQWHQLTVFAELDGNIQIQTALEQRLQLGSIMVTDGGSRFRDGLPAATLCNLVHKAPAFVVASLYRKRFAPSVYSQGFLLVQELLLDLFGQVVP